MLTAAADGRRPGRRAGPRRRRLPAQAVRASSSSSARVHALAGGPGRPRRRCWSGPASGLDPPRREVFRDGRYVPLSRKEFAVLAELLRADGAVVSAEQLLETGLGRARRPVHQHGAGDDDEAAPQARRPAGGRDRAGSGVPDPVSMNRLTIRARLTLVYGGLFLLAGAAAARRHVRAGRPAAAAARGRPDAAGSAGDLAEPGAIARSDGSSTCGRRSSRSQDDASRTPWTSLLTQGGIALAVVGGRRDRVRLADRRAGAAAAAPGHRDRPADRRRPGRRPGTARADRAGRPARRGQGARRHVRRDAGAARPARSTGSGGSSPTPRTSCVPR